MAALGGRAGTLIGRGVIAEFRALGNSHGRFEMGATRDTMAACCFASRRSRRGSLPTPSRSTTMLWSTRRASARFCCGLSLALAVIALTGCASSRTAALLPPVELGSLSSSEVTISVSWSTGAPAFSSSGRTIPSDSPSSDASRCSGVISA